MSDVLWKPIKGFENYFVSNKGDIFNIKTGKLKAKRKTKNGYLITDLKESGRKQTVYIHRVVATAFLINEKYLPCVNHKDEDKTNNAVENLEWCDVRYNNCYKNRHKKVGKILRELSPLGKRVKNIDTGDIFVSVKEAGRKTGITPICISCCISGKQKHAGGYRWEVV